MTRIDGASFRDRSGFIFTHNGKLYRQNNHSYRNEYSYLIKSKLYEVLVNKKLLVPHKEIRKSKIFSSETAYKIIKPQQISFISYPFEWCFSQLKQAALTILKIQQIAFSYGMTLKDASPFNTQFLNGNPILIDTLSFGIYKEGQPWVAYRQFCEQFLGPLALMSHKDVRLAKLLEVYLNGIPLELISRLLPLRAKVNPRIFLHLVWHGRLQQVKRPSPEIRATQIDRRAFQELTENLLTTVQNLLPRRPHSVWVNYHQSSYNESAIKHKSEVIDYFLSAIKPTSAWDLGANTGYYSRSVAKRDIFTLAIDIDHDAVEVNYRQIFTQREKNLLPLWIDIMNPSANLGWGNSERKSLRERGPADLILMLALLHHLAIGQNLPFSNIASYFHDLCKWLIIEFIPKDDFQIQQMLSLREDVFADYSEKNFELTFGKWFKLLNKVLLKNSKRILYLMETRQK